MIRNLSALSGREYDLVIIGAGAFGSCAVWDAASRGLSVALVERGDFCCATSSNHLKVVHGGIRYLQHADLYRVRESCRERTALLRIAPHLVQPLPILMPTYGHMMMGKEVLGMGVILYDLITFDRNKDLRDPERRIPWGRIISREECLNIFPEIKKKKLTGGCIFFDGQFYNPPRLSLAFLRSAVIAGADIGNYLEVTNFLQNSGRVFGVKVRDVLSGEYLEIRGKTVLNTAGPWADRLLRVGMDIQLRPKPHFSRDVGFVVSSRISKKYALACMIKSKDPDAIISREGRHIFLVPWRDYTLIGVWHLVHDKGPDEFTVTQKELQAYIDEINEAYPSLGITMKDVSMVNAGLTLFGENDPIETDLRFGKRSLFIDHAKKHHVEGLLTLIGVRATIARGTAEKAIDVVFKKLGRNSSRSKTSTTPIYGGKIGYFKEFLNKAIKSHSPALSAEVVYSLAHNYGSEYQEVLKYVDENPSWARTVGKSKVIGAEVIHAVREEMAQKLVDVVFRRTDLGTGGFPGEDAINACAELVALEMGWNNDRIQREIDEVRAAFPFLSKNN